MHDKVAHMGIVDSPLRSTFPGIMGGSVVGKDAYDVNFVEVLELNALQIGQFTTKYEMEQLLWSLGFAVGHVYVPMIARPRAWLGRGAAFVYSKFVDAKCAKRGIFTTL